MVMTEFWCWWFLVFLAVVGEQRYSGCWVSQWLVNDGIMVVGIEISFFFFFLWLRLAIMGGVCQR